MDFFGTTTPSDLLASVTTGVQTTGTALWPFFTFVGVLVAFSIATYVVLFIKQTIIQNDNQKKIDKIGSDLVTFNKKADDLQTFFSKKGRSGAHYDYAKIDDMI